MTEKYILKLLTIGDQFVGKSSIINRYIDDKFNENIKPTLAIDYKTKMIQKGENLIKISIYDTAGEEKYRHLIKNYYNGSNGILLVFDITDKNSFDNLNFWLDELEKNCNLNNLYIFLVGNKTDLKKERKVSYDEAKNFADMKKIPYIEISAKTGDNIDKLFNDFIKGTIINIIEQKKKDNSFLKESFKISFLDKDEKTIRDKKCC
jgi:small GTP-binding protein